MAIVSEKSTEYTSAVTNKTPVNATDWHGRVRIAYFEHNNHTGGDAGSDVWAVRLPPGKVRLLGPMSSVYINFATGSSFADVGHEAYTNLAGTAVARDETDIDDGIDTETAGFFTLGSALTASGGTKVYESLDGVDIVITCADVALAANDDVSGYIAYVID